MGADPDDLRRLREARLGQRMLADLAPFEWSRRVQALDRLIGDDDKQHPHIAAGVQRAGRLCACCERVVRRDPGTGQFRRAGRGLVSCSPACDRRLAACTNDPD